MNIADIISVSGKPGLYKILKRSRSGLIVESLLDAKKMPVHSTSKVSSLEDISIYTTSDDKPLGDVLEALHKHTKGEKAINHKSTPDELRNYMLEFMGDYDDERVYPSDLKKLFSWYNLLLEKGLMDAEPKKTEAEEENKEDAKADESSSDKTEENEEDKKAAAPKKAAPKKSTTAKKPTAVKSKPKASAASSKPKVAPKNTTGAQRGK